MKLVFNSCDARTVDEPRSGLPRHSGRGVTAIKKPAAGSSIDDAVGSVEWQRALLTNFRRSAGQTMNCESVELTMSPGRADFMYACERSDA